MYLFFDTETTGLSSHKDHLVQLAWVLADKDGKIVDEDCHVIRPDGYSIPLGAANIHGITTEVACEIGRPLVEVLEKFSDAATRASVIIAHNLTFDLGILKHDYSIANLSYPLHGKTQVCTMKLSTTWCRLPKLNGATGFKWPKLEELYYRLFGEGFDGAHDAQKDTYACMKCYFELVKRNVISPPSNTLPGNITPMQATTDLGKISLHFPKDRSYGTLYIFENSQGNGIFQKREAKGSVMIINSGYVSLCVDEHVSDFSFIANCDPSLVLQELDLRFTNVADADLFHIRKLHSLKKLNLRTQSITGKGFLYLRGISNIVCLDLLGTRITDSCVRHIGTLTSLKSLVLGGTQITDKALKYLEPLKELEELYLWGTQITDSGLQHLRMMHKLKVLSLHRTSISDCSLAFLEKLDGLLKLNLELTSVSEEAKCYLERNIPNCEIL